MKIRINIISFFLLFSISAFSQNIKYAKKIIDTLASPYLFGRSLTYDGVHLAEKIIVSQLKNNRIPPISEKNGYLQNFTVRQNCFFSEPKLIIDNQQLKPGVDFVVAGYSGNFDGSAKIKYFKSSFINKKIDFSDFFLFIPEKLTSDKQLSYVFDSIIHTNPYNAKGFIVEKENLVFVPADYYLQYPVFFVKKGILKRRPKKVQANVFSTLLTDKTSNIIGYIKGITDTFLILTAHYDHIGCLGKKVVFTGANDNASGVAMVLDLAKEFSQRKCRPYYSLAFIFFSGEELGLLGSSFFVENPIIPLDKIKLVINFDLLGSGDEGIMIFNGKENPYYINILEKINKSDSLVKKIVVRKNRPNSDHYSFTKAGVNAIYVLTLGKYKEYHNIYDTRENLPLSDYQDVAKLMFEFIEYINSQAKQRNEQIGNLKGKK